MNDVFYYKHFKLQASADLKLIAEEITNQAVTWAVNSHWHGDHIRGNQTFKQVTLSKY